MTEEELRRMEIDANMASGMYEADFWHDELSNHVRRLIAEVRSCHKFIAAAFEVHSNLDLDIESLNSSAKP